jgi:hypothetical protein
MDLNPFCPFLFSPQTLFRLAKREKAAFTFRFDIGLFPDYSRFLWGIPVFAATPFHLY